MFLTAAWHYSRGIALVATGKLADAEKELATLTPMLAHPALDAPNFSPNTGRAILGIAPEVLAGEIAAAEGEFDKAIAHLERAVRLEDALVYTEPSEWAFPPRHSLGAVLLEAGRAGRGRDRLLGGPEAQPRERLGADRPRAGAAGAEKGRPGRHRRGPAQDGAGAGRRDPERVAVRARADGDIGRGSATMNLALETATGPGPRSRRA